MKRFSLVTKIQSTVNEKFNQLREDVDSGLTHEDISAKLEKPYSWWILDPRKNQCYFSSKFQELLGIPYDDSIDSFQFLMQNGHPQITKQLKIVYRNIRHAKGAAPVHFESIYFNALVGIKWVHTVAHSIEWKRNLEPGKILFLHRDITQIIRKQHQMQSAVWQLERLLKFKCLLPESMTRPLTKGD